MKNIITVIFLLTLGTLLTAQEVDTPKAIFKINFLNPGIGGEFQVTKNQTFTANLNVAPNYSGSSGNKELGIDPHHHFALLPMFDAEYRFYYKKQKRIEKGKTIYNNSGPYLAPRFNYIGNPLFSSYPESTVRRYAELGAIIGFQKTFKSNLQLGLSGGWGIHLYKSKVLSSPVLNLNFSYVILPKRKR